MAGITLDSVEPATVNRHDGALHVDEIVLTQTASIPFMVLNKHYATGVKLTPSIWWFGDLVF